MVTPKSVLEQLGGQSREKNVMLMGPTVLGDDKGRIVGAAVH